MRNKVYVVITLLILIIVVLLTHDKPFEGFKLNRTKLTSIEQVSKNNINEKASVLKKAKNKSKKNKNMQVSDDILDELSQKNFSSEPFVELLTVTYILQDCKRNGVTDFGKIEQLEKLIVKRSENCLKFKSDYPLVATKINSKEFESLIMKIALQSKYANVIQKGMTMRFMDQAFRNDFLEEVVGIILQSQNGPLITSLEKLFKSGEGSFLINKISKELGTINSNYSELVFQQAITLYSCQYSESITCLPSSKYMLRQCSEDERACGVDVLTWFQLSHTDAYNRDIAKVVNYLETLP